MSMARGLVPLFVLSAVLISGAVSADELDDAEEASVCLLQKNLEVAKNSNDKVAATSVKTTVEESKSNEKDKAGVKKESASNDKVAATSVKAAVKQSKSIEKGKARVKKASKVVKHSSKGSLTACSDDSTPVTSAEIAEQESLKDSNGWQNLYIGAATNYNYGMSDESEYWYWQLFSHHFDLTTGENGCKMTQIMWNGPSEFGGKDETTCAKKAWHWGADGPLPMCYKFELCDAITVDTIAALEKPLEVAWRGHALIWGAPDSALSWHPDMAADETVLQNFITSYVNSTLQYYKGKGASKSFAWDTVNEAVKDTATGASTIEDMLKDNDYSGGMNKKYDYIGYALEAARAADPDMKIFYNDYRILWENDKSDAVYKLLQWVQSQGYPIDGIGFQAHINFGFIDDGYDKLVKSNFKRFADLGLDLHITELDVGCNFMSRYKVDGCLADYDNADQPEENSARQAAIYEVVLKACLETPACKVFEMWGFTDYTFGSLPYLFDCDGRPKDAYSKLLSLLKREDASGCAEVAVVKYYLPTYKVVTLKISKDDVTMVEENSTSAGSLVKKTEDYLTSCLTSGIWTLTLSSVYDSAGWVAGSYFSVETRDGTSLISTSTLEADSPVSVTFMVGQDARCTKPEAGDTGADYSSCGGKKLGWKCTVGCQDGYTLSGDTQLFVCSSSGYFTGTPPTCAKA